MLSHVAPLPPPPSMRTFYSFICLSHANRRWSEYVRHRRDGDRCGGKTAMNDLVECKEKTGDRHTNKVSSLAALDSASFLDRNHRDHRFDPRLKKNSSTLEPFVSLLKRGHSNKNGWFSLLHALARACLFRFAHSPERQPTFSTVSTPPPSHTRTQHAY